VIDARDISKANSSMNGTIPRSVVHNTSNSDDYLLLPTTKWDASEQNNCYQPHLS